MSPALGLDEIVARMALALLCGAVVGLNRDLHHKPAGIRTFAFVSIGAALAVLAIQQASDSDPGALSRVMQGILTGIGFVGAGVIFRQNKHKPVAGLTTAAAIWYAASMGVACGLGFYTLALTALAIALLVLIVGGPLERRVERYFNRNPRDSTMQDP
jgi:putative Mg2+ transporter-C (MgtC) family protein